MNDTSQTHLPVPLPFFHSSVDAHSRPLTAEVPGVSEIKRREERGGGGAEDGPAPPPALRVWKAICFVIRTCVMETICVNVPEKSDVEKLPSSESQWIVKMASALHNIEIYDSGTKRNKSDIRSSHRAGCTNGVFLPEKSHDDFSAPPRSLL